MDLTLTEDQRAIRNAAREFLAQAPAANVPAVIGNGTGYSSDLWQAMVKLGWNGLATPERFGGLDSGLVELCLLIEELGRTLIPTPFATTMCSALTIARFGTEEQQATLLPSITEGRVFTCVPAPTEIPGEAVGPAHTGVTATRSANGWIVLYGDARFVPYVGAADRILVVARDDRSGEELVAVVDPAGISETCERRNVLGVEPLYDIRFDGVAVPAGSVLGGPAAAVALARRLTIASCASMVGTAQGVLDLTLEYAGQREQFGAPIGSFQAVQHHCANMAIDVLGSRLLAYEAAWSLDAGTAGDGSEEIDEDTVVSVAKAWTGEACERVCAVGHQVHGAVGFTREHNLHWYLRHVIASGLAFGDTDVHLSRLESGLGL